MQPLIISAPFGNYVHAPGVTSTLGTYTVADRAGVLRWRTAWRVLLTLRPLPRIGGWVNKLGLPNPGLPHLKRCSAEHFRDRILSIHGFDAGEWDTLLGWVRSDCPADLEAVELNVSCPNVGHLSVPADLFAKAIATGRKVIVKLPPVNWWDTYRLAVDSGVRVFHCCNTLPTPAGGLSGKPLKGVSLDVIRAIRRDGVPDLTIIGGGGITEPADIAHYRSAGANRFAIGAALLRPRCWTAYFRAPYLKTLLAAASLDEPRP